MLRRQLLNRARRLAAGAAEPTMTDQIMVMRRGVEIYRGPARFIFTGKTEVATSMYLGFTRVSQFAEMHIRSDAEYQADRADFVTVIESLEPSLVGRTGDISFAEPVTSLTGFQRITVRLSGVLNL